jgi:hypothetical protein
MFPPNRPFSGVHAVIKESAAHCNAVSFLLYGCLGLCALTILNFGVLGLHVFDLCVFCCFFPVLNVFVGAGVCCVLASHHSLLLGRLGRNI